MSGMGGLMGLLGLFSFGAVPETWSGWIHGGPGPAALQPTTVGFNAVRQALGTAASNSDGEVTGMTTHWQGDSSHKAERSFRRHANWLREQADVHQAAAKASEDFASANGAARGAVPTPAEFAAAHAAMEAAAADVAAAHTQMTVGAALGPLGAPVAALGVVHAIAADSALATAEAHYADLVARTEMGVARYTSETQSAMSALPDPISSPDITVNGGNSASDPIHFATQDTGPGYVRDTTPGPTDNTPSQPTNTDQPSNPPTDTTPNQPTNPDQPSQPSAPEQSQAPTDMNQLQQQLDRMDPLTNGNPPPSPLGTSPYSSTQMAMMGSMMAGGFFSLGMTPGSMGSMAGAATGFRMPANWSNGTAYGASNAPANAPVRAPIRKVSAAKKQMRKRREENSESKVYVPGEPQEVPVLEQPPVIGVLDASDDHEDTPVLESALPVGVLEYVDDDEREDTAKSVPTR